MDYLPLMVQVRQKSVLVIGGGSVAARKVRLLLRAEAAVTVIACDIHSELKELAVNNSLLTLMERAFTAADMGMGMHSLIIAATADEQLNAEVATLAQQAHIWVNVVDSPALSTVIFPALVDRSPLLVAISSSGAAPVLVRQVRAQIESLLPGALGLVATAANRWRNRVKIRFTDSQQRRRFWERVLTGRFSSLILAQRLPEADLWMEQAMSTPEECRTEMGEVYLAGAGPGDPDLLTIKTLNLMQQADVIVYDRLVSPEILERCRRDAEFIYVGKANKQHTVPQPTINQLLVDLALQGKRVCRLKGGDPFIFGRGGEEMEHLVAAGIPFQIIPGISAANGCAAYAGIPLTHRDYAQSVRFVTGHLREEGVDLPWQELIHEQQTLVIYMSLMGLPNICQQLLKHGMRKDMPVALISRGTFSDQKVVKGTVATIAQQVAELSLHAPTLTIVGEVVRLSNHLAWFAHSLRP